MKRMLERMNHVLLAVAVLAVLSLTSCEHKDLCHDSLHVVNVKVVFDWRKAPDAAPASMSLYDAFCLNSDTENVTYRNTGSKTTFEVTTRTADLLSGLSALGVRSAGVPRARGTEDERIVLPPDMLWSDHAEGIGLNQETAAPTITLYPAVSVCRYTVEIRNAKNLKYVSGVGGSISGLAGGLLPGTGADALRSMCDKDGEKTVITGGLLTFGHKAGNNHTLTVYAVLADGSKWYYTYDVTDQIHSAPDPRNVHIVLDGLPLPKPIVNGGGFQPEVEDWQTVPIDIEM